MPPGVFALLDGKAICVGPILVCRPWPRVQVELFTLHGSLRRIVDALTRKWGYRLACVQLVDAHLCRWATQLHSGCVLRAMLMCGCLAA